MNGFARWRAGGVERLAPTLGLFLAGCFLLPSGKALNNVFYALVLTPALFLLRGSDWRWLADAPLWRAAMLLLGYLTVSGLWSDDFTVGAWLREAKALPYLTVYLAVVAAVVARRPRAWALLLRAVAVAAAVGTLVSMLLYYRGAPLSARLEYYGAVYNANEAATLVGASVLLTLFHILPASGGRALRCAWSVVAVLLATGIALTGSRMPVAALLACVGLGLVLQQRWRLLGAYGVILAALIGGLVAGNYDYRGAVERGASYRPAIWQQFGARVAARPWVGEGILTNDAVELPAAGASATELVIPHPHSVYLATALYGGLPAAGLLGAVIWLALRRGLVLAGRGESAWLLMLVFGLLCMVTDGDRLLHAPKAVWFYFWFPVAVLIGREAAPAEGSALGQDEASAHNSQASSSRPGRWATP